MIGVVALVLALTSHERAKADSPPASGLPLASQSAVVDMSQPGRGFGNSVDSAGDTNGDGYDDVIVGSVGYDDVGAAFLFLGGPDGIATGDASSASAILRNDGRVPPTFGCFVAGVGDTNDDGYDDVAVGTNEAVYVFHGGPGGIASQDLTTAATELRMTGAYCVGIAGAGDTNGDGYDDLLLSTSYQFAGGALLFLGGPAGIPSGGNATADTVLTDAAEAELEWSVAGVGDTNHDGFDDIAVGLGEIATAFIFRGRASGIPSGDVTTAQTILTGSASDFDFGAHVAGAGDVNGDGYDDVIVAPTAENATGKGIAFVFHGRASGIPSGTAALAASRLNTGMAGVIYYVKDVAGIGDVNGDGFDDVAVFSSTSSIQYPGVFVYLGSAGKGVWPWCAERIEPREDNVGFSPSLAGAGDVNADGYGDLLIGYPDYFVEGEYHGRALIYNGAHDRWKMVSYDHNSLAGRTSSINDAYEVGTLQDYPVGFAQWTHIAAGPRFTFFYNSGTGAAAIGTVGLSGRFTTVASYSGVYAGWTHVVWHGDILVLYRSSDSVCVATQISPSTLEFTGWTAYGLGPGWTHIVSVPGFLVFYCAGNGASASCRLTPVVNASGTVTKINFQTVRNNTLSTGWTHIVDSRHGILFYNASTGVYRIGDFNPLGVFVGRVAPWPPWSWQPLWQYSVQRVGWTSVTACGDRLLFYDKETGEGMTGYVRTAAQSEAEQAEPLAPVQTLPWGTLSNPVEMKWSHVVSVPPW